MARALIILMAAILAMGNSCETASERLNAAATVQGQARAGIARPETPEACVAHIDRVYPKVGEKARWTQKRWEIVADNRDRLADDCRSYLDEYWESVAEVGAK